MDRGYLSDGIPDEIPPHPGLDPEVDHAPKRIDVLNSEQKRLAVRNALRYFDQEHHAKLAPEFAQELSDFGRIYMLRYRPVSEPMRAYPIETYPAKSPQTAAIMHMIQNNLDPEVAQFPNELITYGGNGSVFQNWAQYLLTMQYLSQMSDEQTLVMYSGHPLGVFPSNRNSPRVVITNGMVIPNYSTTEDYDRMNALGVTQYGQMTAGSYMYIGPQGIVHGTTITILNAARKYLQRENLEGVTFVSSGLGGMSGAQAKAAVIAGATCIVAEINPAAATKRHLQKWIDEITDDVDSAIDLLIDSRDKGESKSIGFIGNIVDLWERLDERNVTIDLGSDQTSLHNPWQGGYFPVGLSFEESSEMMSKFPDEFRQAVRNSLCRHADAINSMVSKGTYFWDYGNAFMLECSRAGANILDEKGHFKYPSYVEDIMGPMCFDYGFGPFRWVCCSGLDSDLEITDRIAKEVLISLAEISRPEIRQQMLDNIRWIKEAGENKLVVGSRARILYADEQGRMLIASAFNEAVKSGLISGPIVLGRDHHDVSGTDSPYRETANIKDGSMFTADMAVQNFVGDSFRGATWVSLHNGGGVGWGEVINGGFGLVLDGTEEADQKLKSMLSWDVNNGIARRAWGRNEGAINAINAAMEDNENLQVTIPNLVEDDLLEKLF